MLKQLMLKRFWIIMGAIAGSFLLTWGVLWTTLAIPVEPQTSIVNIEKGMSLKETANLLKSQVRVLFPFLLSHGFGQTAETS